MYKINKKDKKNIEDTLLSPPFVPLSQTQSSLYLLSRYHIILLSPFLPRGFIYLFIWYDKNVSLRDIPLSFQYSLALYLWGQTGVDVGLYDFIPSDQPRLIHEMYVVSDHLIYQGL